MKAVVCTKLGKPNLLEIKDIDKPTINKDEVLIKVEVAGVNFCLLYTSPSPRDNLPSRMPSSA